MTTNYGSSIPGVMTEVFEREISNYQQKQRDARLARNLNTIRNVGSSVQTDTVTYYEKSGGNTSISATITAKGATPPLVSVKGKQVSHVMYQLSSFFNVNERDLHLDPKQQSRKVDVATRDIGRLEDYIWINGDTPTGLTGIVTAARANPNGKVVASGAAGSDVNNTGAWSGADNDIDIYTDIVAACDMMGDNFEPQYLVGRRVSIAPIRKMDDLRKRYSDEILDLFGANSPKDFIRTSAYFPAGFVYVLAKDMEFEEFVISEDLRVDTSVGKDTGGNFPVVLREWLNPVEIHSNEGIVEIAIT